MDSSKQIELINHNAVLSCIREADGMLSRADIAKRVGLSRTTLSSSIARLHELGLVEETPKAGSALGPGRPGIPVSLTKDRWFAAGATLLDSDLFFALLSLDGKVVNSFSIPVTDNTSGAYLSGLAEGFKRLIGGCPGKILPLLGVGSPGIIHDGMITGALDMGWKNVPVNEYLKEQTGYSSEIINRHWASCLAEYQETNPGSMIYVGVSTGIAAALCFEGRLFTGASHQAGEIGHTVVMPDGPLCACGRRGCLHAVSSERALIEKTQNYYKMNPGPLLPGDPLWALASDGKSVDIASFVNAAETGHPLARQELSTAAKYLGLSISNLIGMFNPREVVLGGSLIDRAGETFYDQVVQDIASYSRADVRTGVVFRPWKLGRCSGAIGAARLVLEKKVELASAALQ